METLGRCPDCGESVVVRIIPDQPGEIQPHRCRARLCEYPGCRITRLIDDMVQFDSAEWYCPTHALLAVARDLVRLYRTEGEADWTAICEILGETLPEILAAVEPDPRRSPRPSST